MKRTYITSLTETFLGLLIQILIMFIPILLKKATLMSCWNPIFITLLQKKFFSDIIVQKFLNVFFNSLQLYKIFREERYIQKIKKLSDTIKKYNFPNLGHISKSDSEQKKSSSNTTKKIAQTQKIIDIARSRGIHMKEVLDIVSSLNLIWLTMIVHLNL